MRGEALRDEYGRRLCVRMVGGFLVAADTPENRAIAYPMTDEELDAAPDGLHAVIRVEVE